MWQEITLASLQPGDPPQMKLFGSVLRRKYRDRDEANTEKIADIKFTEQTTTSSSWTTLESREIRIPPDFNKLYIRGYLEIATLIGEEAIAHIRFTCSTATSTEDSVQGIVLASKTFDVNIDLSSLSGIQTLNMQGKITNVSGGGTKTMKGKVLTNPDNERRYDCYFARAA